MTNEELMGRFSRGDESVLEELCTQNKEMLSDLERIGVFGYPKLPLRDIAIYHSQGLTRKLYK